MNNQAETALPPISTENGSLQSDGTDQIPGVPVSFDLKPSSKDVMIGAGGLLILIVVFFFIRMSFVNYLVGTLRRSPNNASLAGSFLFGGLLFGSAIGCTALVGKSFMILPVIVTLSALSLICFVLTLVVASKKQ